MANEEQANRAREEHGDFLREMGAHGITIDEIKRKGEKSFAVVALFQSEPAEVPDQLEIKRGKVTISVPLVARVVEKFRPQ